MAENRRSRSLPWVIMGNVLDDDQRYRAVHSRDPRFDGIFYTAVRTTGIYCRPSCPAQTPRRENTRFFPTAAAAQEAGFRACKRCRPDLAPGSPEWNGRADTVGRAMRLIQDGAVDRAGVDGLARHLGYSTRQLRRLLIAEVGAGPVALARSERAQTARVLTETTDMPLTDIAFAAGFGSVRQFNETMRAVHGRSPTQMRTRGRSRPDANSAPGAITLRLPYREPIDLDAMLQFLGDRAVPGVESHDGRTYRRVLRLPGGPGTVELSPGPNGPYVLCRLRLTDPADLTTAVRRCRRMLDLDADPTAVAEALGEDPLLGGIVRGHQGIRSPGHADPAELAARAVLGQQVSVKAARTLAGRLAERFGRPLPEGLAAGDSNDGDTGEKTGLTRVFPSPETLASAHPADLGLPPARGRALTGLAEAIATGRVDLGPGADREATGRALVGLHGIGPWTADHIRMRGLGDPDVFLSGDLGVRVGLEALGVPGAPKETAAIAHRWSPWRSYATHLLWASLNEGESTETTDTGSRE